MVFHFFIWLKLIFEGKDEEGNITPLFPFKYKSLSRQIGSDGAKKHFLFSFLFK